MAAIIETFTGADSPGVLTADHVWALIGASDAFGKVGNKAALTASVLSAHDFARCTDVTADSANYSVSVTLTAIPSSPAGTSHLGPMARMTLADGNGYECRLIRGAAGAEANIFKWTGGSEALLGSTVSLMAGLGITPAVGDVITIQVSGTTTTTINFYYQVAVGGGPPLLVNTTTDSSSPFTAGRLGGVHGLRTDAADSVSFDTWTMDPASVPVAPATVTETFTHADAAGVLGDHTWQVVSGTGLAVVSNAIAVVGDAAVAQYARCTDVATVSNDMDVVVTLKTWGASGVFTGPEDLGVYAVARASLVAFSGYWGGIYMDPLNVFNAHIVKYVAGVFTSIASVLGITNIAAGDSIRLHVALNALSLYITRGGVETLTIGPVTDTSNPTGPNGGFQAIVNNASDYGKIAIESWSITPAAVVAAPGGDLLRLLATRRQDSRAA